MRDRKIYKKIRNSIIASAGTGMVAGMFLVGGMNTVYAETVNRVIPVYTYKKSLDKTASYSELENSKPKKNISKGWRRNQG